jgi:hypothetical protein
MEPAFSKILMKRFWRNVPVLGGKRADRGKAWLDTAGQAGPENRRLALARAGQSRGALYHRACGGQSI